MTIYEKTQKIFREAEEKQRIEWENDTDSLREQTLIEANNIIAEIEKKILDLAEKKVFRSLCGFSSNDWAQEGHTYTDDLRKKIHILGKTMATVPTTGIDINIALTAVK